GISVTRVGAGGKQRAQSVAPLAQLASEPVQFAVTLNQVGSVGLHPPERAEVARDQLLAELLNGRGDPPARLGGVRGRRPREGVAEAVVPPSGGEPPSKLDEPRRLFQVAQQGEDGEV